MHQADKTIGKVIITSAGLAEIRHRAIRRTRPCRATTSCIDAAGNEINSTKVDKGAARPVLSDIGTLLVQSSPAFTRFTPGSTDRPRVGDFAIYAKDKGSGPADAVGPRLRTILWRAANSFMSSACGFHMRSTIGCLSCSSSVRQQSLLLSTESVSNRRTAE